MWLDAHAASDCEELPAITMKQAELICALVKAHKYLVILVLFLFSDFNKYNNNKTANILEKTRKWASPQPDGRPAEHRWRPLFNAAKFG